MGFDEEEAVVPSAARQPEARAELSLTTMLVHGTTAPATVPPEPEEIDAVASWARASGFAAVELSDRWLPVGDRDCWLRVAERLERAGLPSRSVTVFRRMPVGETAVRDAAALRFAVEIAGLVGGAVTSVAVAADSREQWRPLSDAQHADLVALLGELAASAAEDGSRLAVELHDDGPFDSAEAVLDVLDEIGDLAVGVNPDLVNRLRRDPGWDWEDALRRMAPRSILWHVKNVKAGAASHLDDGLIDYERAIAVMLFAGFCGAIVPETRFGASPLEAAARAARWMAPRLTAGRD